MIEPDADQNRISLFASNFGAMFDFFNFTGELFGWIGCEEECHGQWAAGLRRCFCDVAHPFFRHLNFELPILGRVGNFEQVFAPANRAIEQAILHVPGDDAAIDRAANFKFLFFLFVEFQLFLEAH